MPHRRFTRLREVPKEPGRNLTLMGSILSENAVTVFRFQLDPLLRHRQRQEDECRRALALLQRQRLDLEAWLRATHEEIEDEKTWLTNDLQGPVRPDALRAHAATVGQLRRAAQQIVYQLADLARHIEHARSQLIEATKRRRSLARLRELRYDAWRQDLKRAEQHEFDDLVNSRRPGVDTGELTGW